MKTKIEIYQRAMKYAPIKEVLLIIWWFIFRHKRYKKMNKCILLGYHWKAALIIAKEQ